MRGNTLLSARYAVQAGTAMADLALAAMLGVLLQAAGGVWLPALPPAVVWAGVSTLRVIRARVAAESSGIALYRMLGGSAMRLAARAMGEAALLYVPAVLAALVAASWLLPGTRGAPAVLMALAGAALASGVYAARLACRIAPCYATAEYEAEVGGMGGVSGQPGALALLHKLYGYLPPLRSRPADYLGAQWRTLRATFFLLISALVLGKHAESPAEGESDAQLAVQDGDAPQTGHMDSAAADGVPPAPAQREAHAATIRLVDQQDHQALSKMAGLQTGADSGAEAARLGGRELLALSGVPWLQDHVHPLGLDTVVLAPASTALLPASAAEPLHAPEFPLLAHAAPLVLAHDFPLQQGGPLPLMLTGGVVTMPIPDANAAPVASLPETVQVPVQLIGTVILVALQVTDIDKA